MVYILTLLIFSGGNVAVATAEYNNSEACEAARTIDERALATAFRPFRSSSSLPHLILRPLPPTKDPDPEVRRTAEDGVRSWEG